MNIKKVRMPLCSEWAVLACVTIGDNRKMHYQWMGSWCQEADLGWPGRRMYGGGDYPCTLDSNSAAARWANIGFRPVFEVSDNEDLPEGIVATVGTFFMNNNPIKVPENPTLGGDITCYIPGAKLEFREAIDDPAYQVRAIKIGDVYIADRVLLNCISWEDIVETFGPAESVATCKSSVLEKMLAENAGNLEDPSDKYAQGYHDAIVDVMKKLGFPTKETYFD